MNNETVLASKTLNNAKETSDATEFITGYTLKSWATEAGWWSRFQRDSGWQNMFEETFMFFMEDNSVQGNPINFDYKSQATNYDSKGTRKDTVYERKYVLKRE